MKIRRSIALIIFLLAGFAVFLFRPQKHRYLDFPDTNVFAQGGIPIITRQSVNDYQCLPNPGNPPSGYVRVYCDSSTGQLTAINSNGISVLAGSSGGISPTSFGAKWDAKFVYDAQITNASGAVSCPQSDCWFSSSDVGKQGFGASSTNIAAFTSVGLVLPQSAVQSVTDANHITMTSVATATCTPSGTILCTFADGTDDTTAINAAFTAAWSTPKGQCLPVVFPAGNAFFSGPVGNLTITQLSSACGGSAGNSAQSGADTNQSGPSVYGCGPECSILIPLPTYNFAGCTFYTGTSCNFTTASIQAHDFGINGLGVSLSGAPHSNIFVDFVASGGGGACTGVTAFNLNFANFGDASAGLTGLRMGNFACGDPLFWNNVSEMLGTTNCEFDSFGPFLNTNFSGIACFGALTQAVRINCGSTATAVVNTQYGFYGDIFSGSAPIVAQTGCIWNSTGDSFLYNSNQALSGTTMYFNNSTVSSTAFFTNDQFQLTGGASSPSQIFFSNASAGTTTIHLRNSQIAINGSNQALFNISANTVFMDDGGNTWVAGSGTLPGNASTISGQFIADGKIKAIGTGVCTAGSTLGLKISGASTAGTAIPTTCTSTNIDAGIPIQGARTAFGLRVVTSAGGVNASSGVFTVLKNGVATAITCTLGTATTCNDFTHSASFADGDLISLNFTTQAAETLANPKVVIDWF